MTSSHCEGERRLKAELTVRDEQLANKVREAEGLRRQLVQLRRDHDSLKAAHEAVLRSTSWRLTGPLRGVGRLTVELPGSLIAPLRRGQRARIELARVTTQRQSEISPVFVPRPIADAEGPARWPRGEKGRLICMTHVLPYPPRAGNEYRIHRMLTWLDAQGWDVLLLVCPLADAPITSGQLAEAAAHYTNLIVCQRDGTLAYHLADGGAMVQGLRGRRPRAFGPLLRETDNGRHAPDNLPSILRMFCPDMLVELLLHVEAEFDPRVLFAEYVFMTRPLTLLRPGVFKIVDAHDVFSTRQTKVAQYGIQDILAIAPELEAELLNRADLLIAIQGVEAEQLRKLAPGRQVISVGVDFTLLDHVPPPAARPVVVLVASANPMNVKGLKDFVRFAWPLVRAAVPDAELQVIGAVGEVLDPLLPSVRILGRVENLVDAYANARVIINPTVAGTGLKIKTVEALCHLRPVVVWPSGADGLSPDMCALCHVASNWYDFAQHVIDLVSHDDSAQVLIDRRRELASQFGAETIYAPLRSALASNVATPKGPMQASKRTG